MVARRLFPALVSAILASTTTLDHSLAVPQKMFAIGHGRASSVVPFEGNPNPGDTIMFYDVTDVETGSASGVFNNDPLFSVWMGFEVFEGQVGGSPTGATTGNREEISAITFNPANGTVYVASFDSGSPPAKDLTDTIGDYDLYRIDYQGILKDFVDNDRPRGTIYGPKALNATAFGEESLESSGSPLFDGVVDGRAHDIPHPEGATRTVNLDNGITKIGEFGRTSSNVIFPNNSGSFFDNEIDFVNPETLIFLDTALEETADDDFQIRVLNRVSRSQGAATQPPLFDSLQEGGYNDDHNLESWESKIAGRLQMDGTDRTEPAGWALVKNNGTLGVWVADSDGGGDDVSFFEINLNSVGGPTVEKKELADSAGGPFPTAFAVDEDPASSTGSNDGEVDQLFVDRNGNLLVLESGFFDDPQIEPRVLTVGIDDYDSPDSDASASGSFSGDEVLTSGTGFDDTSAWSASSPAAISGPIDDDTEVTNSTKVAYDKGANLIYIIDQDGDFAEDIYVIDATTGDVVYSELSPFNVDLFNVGTQIVFTRGDINDDGLVNGNDLTTLANWIADPTIGGTVTADVGQEWFDLTGDGLLTDADLTELQKILSPDFDADGDVDGFDFLAWQRGFPTLDAANLAEWEAAFGSGVGSLSGYSNAVPEPVSLVLGLIPGVILFLRRPTKIC